MELVPNAVLVGGAILVGLLQLWSSFWLALATIGLTIHAAVCLTLHGKGGGRI